MEAAVPVLLAVDEDPQSLSAIERELTDRYARSYRVVCVASAEEARAQLEAAASAGEDAALVLAPEWIGETSGSEFLGDVHVLHPHAQRGLLIEWRSWGDGRTGNVARAERGFVLTGDAVESSGSWSCERSPLALETSMPGVFAAGDVRQGSMTRVASAVGEGSIAIKLVHELFAAERQHEGDRV